MKADTANLDWIYTNAKFVHCIKAQSISKYSLAVRLIEAIFLSVASPAYWIPDVEHSLFSLSS